MSSQGSAHPSSSGKASSLDSPPGHDHRAQLGRTGRRPRVHGRRLGLRHHGNGNGNGNAAGRRFRASPTGPTPSPSGTLLLKLVESEQQRDGKAWRYLSLQILSWDGQLRFEPRHRFAAWFAVVVGWDAQDRVWLRSGDIGVRMWAPEAGGWKEHVWQADGPAIPSADRVIWDAETGLDVPIIGGPLPDVLQE